MRIVTALISLSLLSVAPQSPAPPQGSLQGVIADSEGAVIPNAYIIVHWDSSGSMVGLRSNVGVKGDLHVSTDRRGSFLVQLPPGFYDVFVAATAFSPKCEKVRVKPSETVQYRANLRADPLVMKELGDVFPN